MRPIRLEVEGFTCYRERQQPLDFSSLSLFAIAGPTGAGKSSILDTMLYALYGEVPRIGKQGIGEFISHGRDVMSVCLDFRVGGRDYRVTRLSKRGRQGALKTEATLAELVGGLEKSLADAVKPVNEAVVALLGLRYDEFIQTVVLPQGDFAKFLKAKPTEQREILQHLLRHDVYVRMREAAEERRKQLDGRIQVLDGKIATYAEATPEALAAHEALLVEARVRVAVTTEARNTADAALQEAQRCHALTKEVEKLRRQRQAIEQQAPEVERARGELAQARRAMPILPRLEAAGAGAARADAARRAREQAATTMDRAAAGRAQAATRWEAATAAAIECTPLTSRVQALDEIAAELSRRAELTTAMASVPPRIASAEADAKVAAKSEGAARKTVEQARAAAQALRAAHDEVAFDEPLCAQIETAFAKVGEARAQERDLAALTSDVDSATRARAVAEHDEQTARRVHHTAGHQAEEVAREAAAAKRALEDGNIRHRAAALREHLHAGDDCPVCLQVVIEVPNVTAPPELAALERADRAAADRAARAETARQTAVTALATASARLEAAVTAVSAARARAQARATTLDALLATLSAAVPGAPAAESGAAVLGWLERRRTELLAARSERARHAEALRKAEDALSTSEVALAHAAGDAKAAMVRHEQLLEDQARLAQDLAAVVERIQAVTTSDDPQAERKALVARVARLCEAERAAKEALATLDLEVTAAQERLRAAEASMTEANADAESAHASLARALAAGGFSSADEVKTATRTPAQQAALESQVTTFDQQRAGIVDRLAELEPQVAQREVSADALVDVEVRRKAAMDAWQASSQRVATLESEVARLQKALAALAALAVERDAVRIELGVTAEMAADLKGDRFQNYLLEEAFKALVTGASVRMREISNRYTLEWQDSEFHVVDHDNAGERRRADTLSGGEMFMASLCLALQLSEEVLKTSGALQMDSLFIDEGFGTLDLDSLSEVTDAIEALGQHGGRLIGVISHRAELTDRMPGCIRIDKGAGESHWVMERAG